MWLTNYLYLRVTLYQDRTQVDSISLHKNLIQVKINLKNETSLNVLSYLPPYSKEFVVSIQNLRVKKQEAEEGHEDDHEHPDGFMGDSEYFETLKGGTGKQKV